MRNQNAHLPDKKLMLYADGEVRGREESTIREHLAACWSCRLRMREFDDAIAEFSRLHRQIPGQQLPPADGPRALLKARLREMSEANRSSSLAQWLTRQRVIRGMAYLTGILVLLTVVWLSAGPSERNAIPRAELTPGVVRPVAAAEVCRARLNDNVDVVPAVQRQVFAEYGMAHAEAKPYEVDYLVTPALGGSDDIRNLWPQPYSGSPWNAYVKDALEDRLWRMVCTGQIDLATAQREIAVNWVAAYRKYFHTRGPLPQHQRFRREDEPE